LSISNIWQKGVLQIETHHIREMKKRYESLFDQCTDDEKPAQLKKYDRNLIKELVKDGRTNVKDLAKTLDLHISAVSKRIAALTSARVIKNSAIPNPAKFGFVGNAFIVLTVNTAKVDEICGELYACPEVHLIMTMINGSEVVVGVQTPNNAYLYDFIKNKMSRIDYIQNTELWLVPGRRIKKIQ
jgi:DNA-binding Lrp family transcriptional regulator